MNRSKLRRQLHMIVGIGLLLLVAATAGTVTAAETGATSGMETAAAVFEQSLDSLVSPQIAEDERVRYDEFTKERQEAAEKEAALLAEEQREIAMKKREFQYQIRKAFAASMPENTALNRLFSENREELVMQFLQVTAAGEEQPIREQELAKDQQNVSAKIASSRGSRLKGNDRRIYKYVRKEIRKIAAGEREETEILYPGYLLLGDKTEFTAADLGEKEIIRYGRLTEEAEEAFFDLFDCDFRRILDSLVADLPYDLYWYDSVTHGCSAGMTTEGFGDENLMTIVFTDYDGEQIRKVVRYPVIHFAFSVSADYRAGDVGGYYVDAGKTGAARKAAERAKMIVQGASKRTDLEKLEAYCQVICGLADYNETISGDYVNEGHANPWQVINVFDGDPATKTLCAGYARAFQLLCDLTEFDSPEIRCYTVTGRRNGDWHMWNVVHMDDGKNYLADITSCDGAVMMNTEGFLQGLDKEEGEASYQYDNRTVAMYDVAELELSGTDYGDPSTDGGEQVAYVTPVVKLVKKSFAWTGEEVHPEIMVRAGDAEQLTPAEYIVSYDRTPVDAGEYEVRVTLKGHLRGTGTAAFRILPRGE